MHVVYYVFYIELGMHVVYYNVFFLIKLGMHMVYHNVIIFIWECMWYIILFFILNWECMWYIIMFLILNWECIWYIVMFFFYIELEMHVVYCNVFFFHYYF